jgi:hypothetical protein
MAEVETPLFDIADLMDQGVLWAVNRAVFHPRGFALKLHVEGRNVLGWSIEGDGSEPWHMALDDATMERQQKAFDALENMLGGLKTEGVRRRTIECQVFKGPDGWRWVAVNGLRETLGASAGSFSAQREDYPSDEAHEDAEIDLAIDDAIAKWPGAGVRVIGRESEPQES